MNRENHEAVMVKEVINNLILDKKGNYIDCTFGLGGHTKAILGNLESNAALTSLDRDFESSSYARALSKEDKRFTFIHDNFGNLQDHFSDKTIDGIFLDLGISSKQLDDPERGFSFQSLGPLDMRMNKNDSFSAKDWINETSKEQIARVLWEKGEERRSKKIADRICREREVKPINSTKHLSEIIKSCKPGSSKKHPSTNTFRAIRMEVNSEIEELRKVLYAAGSILREGGRLVVISFHSLEDRIVKRFIQGKDYQTSSFSFQKVGKNFIRPNKEEIKLNPRSRSAILRTAERVT
ncbi:MAG: 16S rRNA (cytosine(1402)-N(4))-methyltransferase RsmH [Gammaproteobacteria bacterium]